MCAIPFLLSLRQLIFLHDLKPRRASRRESLPTLMLSALADESHSCLQLMPAMCAFTSFLLPSITGLYFLFAQGSCLSSPLTSR